MDILDSIGWGYQHLNCRACGAQHKLKMLYIFILALLLILPIPFIDQIRNLILKMSLNIAFVVLFYITYISIIVGFYPFVIKYSFKGDKDLNF